MDRVINFIHWYKHLKTEGLKMGWNTKEIAHYSRYNTWNCFRWSFVNSGTHYIDGTYFKGEEIKLCGH